MPDENKPFDYHGAIGNFEFDASASPKEVKVGDPVTLTSIVRGEGNVNSVDAPRLTSEKGFRVYEPQSKQDKEGKSFEQVVMPLDAGITEIPALSFTFLTLRPGSM